MHFHDILGSPTDRNTYFMSLAHDLALQNLDTTGSINEMQKQLKKALMLEFIVLSEIEEHIAHRTISSSI